MISLKSKPKFCNKDCKRYTMHVKVGQNWVCKVCGN